ncbi:554_t:CDS:2, partial [Racocetra fulgida]
RNPLFGKVVVDVVCLLIKDELFSSDDSVEDEFSSDKDYFIEDFSEESKKSSNRESNEQSNETSNEYSNETSNETSNKISNSGPTAV